MVENNKRNLKSFVMCTEKKEGKSQIQLPYAGNAPV